MARFVAISGMLMLVACTAELNVDFDERDPAEIREVQSSRFRAMIDADAGALERMLADELVYTHTTGRVETKREFIEALTSKAVSYDAITSYDAEIRFYGNTSVITGGADFEVTAGDQQLAFPIRFTEVYEWMDGRWQLVAWQSTRLPD